MLRVTTYTVVLFVALWSWSCPQGQSPASGNNVKQSDDALFTQAMKAINNSNYSEARTLLEIASDLAPGVLAGKPLAPRKSAAYTGSGFR